LNLINSNVYILEMETLEKSSQFDKIYYAFLQYKLNHNDTQHIEDPYTVTWLKQFIKSYYLQRGHPIPRSCTTNRYANSIYAIANNNT